jgi:hypothetical protein
VFWIGFNVAMFAASRVNGNRSGSFVMGVAESAGAIAVIGADAAR